MSREPIFECIHLQFANLLPMAEEVLLDELSLEVLITQRRISKETKQACLLRKQDCEGQGVILVSATIPKYATARWVFVSVWTGYRKSYCLLERVIFTFDKQDFKLVCKCSGSSRIGCVQKPIARWYLRTVYEDLFLERVKPSRNLSDGLRMSFSVDTEYLYHSKRISVNQSMPLSTFHLI